MRNQPQPCGCRDVGRRPLLEGSDSEADSVNSSIAPSPRPNNAGTTSSGAPSPSAPWRLVITGHSLGAGIAAFAGLFLHTLYPGVRVFCYSPPAWLMTPELAKFTEQFVTSVVINKDLFSRSVVLSQLVALLLLQWSHCPRFVVQYLDEQSTFFRAES